MKILSLDPSLSETGWYFKVENTEEFGIIKTKTKNIERLIDIRTEIEKLINYFKPEIIIYEDYSFGSRGRGVFSLGELGGVLKTLIYEKNVKLIIVNSMQWKKFVLDKGNLKKEQVLMQVYKKFGKEFKNNNICDAFCLYKFGEAYSNYMNGSREFKKYELDVLEKFSKEPDEL